MSVHAYRFPDNSLEVDGVKVPESIVQRGREAISSFVIRTKTILCDLALDNIENMDWPTCYICGRPCSPEEADHRSCEAYCRRVRDYGVF